MEYCSYFVLDWDDPFAVPAALAYASACEATYPELAKDLRDHAKPAAPAPSEPTAFDTALAQATAALDHPSFCRCPFPRRECPACGLDCDACRRVAAPSEPVSEACPACRGQGVGLLDEAGMMTCPRCNGTGRTPKDREGT